MKMSFLSVSVFATGLVFAGTTEVTDDYVIGVMPVSVPSRTQVVLSIPWVQQGTGADIAVSNVVKTAGLTAGTDENGEGDVLSWYDTEQGKFQSWRLVKRNGTNYWTAASTTGGGSLDAIDAAASKLKQGQAIVLSTTTNTPFSSFYVIGQVGTNATVRTTIAGAGSSSAKYTLLAPPGALDRALDLNSEADFHIINGTIEATATTDTVAKDAIVTDVVNSAPVTYVYCNSKWRPTYNLTSDSVPAKVPAGCGFWYKRVGAGDLTVEWPAATISSTPSGE